MHELTPEDIALVGEIARGLESRCRLPWQELQSLGWLGLLRAARTFDPSRGVEFGAWATLKVRGEIKDKLRIEYGSTQLGTSHRMKKHPQTVEDLEALDATHRNQTSDFAQLENRDLCDWMLSHLTPRYQEAFRLRFYHGYNEQEIADFMGVCEGRVSQILRRGCERLRKELKVEFFTVVGRLPVDEPLLAL